MENQSSSLSQTLARSQILSSEASENDSKNSDRSSWESLSVAQRRWIGRTGQGGTEPEQRERWNALPPDRRQIYLQRFEKHTEPDIAKALAALGTIRGRRYAGCDFDTYAATTAPQRKMLATVKSYVADLEAQIDAGVNVLLHGSVGSGKDHILMAMMKAAVRYGLVPYGMADVAKFGALSNDSLVWANGVDLLADFRDFEKPAEWFDRLKTCRVLCISDPGGPRSELTPWQVDNYARVLDARYSAVLPTWLTVNVKGAKGLSQLMSDQLADRLAGDSVTAFFNWESGR